MHCNDADLPTNSCPMKSRLFDSPVSVSTTITSSHSSTSFVPNPMRIQMHDQWSGSDSNSSLKTAVASFSGSITVPYDIREIHERAVFCLSKRKFRPLYPARAHFNVFIAKITTKDLLVMIAEDFDDDRSLYYYIDISTALQMNDDQMFVWCLSMRRKVERVSFIHYDLHCRFTGEVLYAVVVPNVPQPKLPTNAQRVKWAWRVETFLTAKDIKKWYGVREQELPRSSRSRFSFKAQLFGEKTPITEVLVEETEWHFVSQIKSLQRKGSVKKKNLKIKMTEREWKDNVKRSLSDDTLPMVPVVVKRDNQHWIEWVKMLCIDSYKVFVGISCRDMGDGCWKVQSIDLDAGRIYSKYRLVGIENKKMDQRLKAMQSGYSIIEIQFVRNETRTFMELRTRSKAQLRWKSTMQRMPPRMQRIPAAVESIDDIVDNVLRKEQKVPSNEMYKFQNFGNEFNGSVAPKNHQNHHRQNYHQSFAVVRGNPVYLDPATAATVEAMSVNQQFVAFPVMNVKPMAYDHGNGATDVNGVGGTYAPPETVHHQSVAVPAEYVWSGFH